MVSNKVYVLFFVLLMSCQTANKSVESTSGEQAASEGNDNKSEKLEIEDLVQGSTEGSSTSSLQMMPGTKCEEVFAQLNNLSQNNGFVLDNRNVEVGMVIFVKNSPGLFLFISPSTNFMVKPTVKEGTTWGKCVDEGEYFDIITNFQIRM